MTGLHQVIHQQPWGRVIFTRKQAAEGLEPLGGAEIVMPRGDAIVLSRDEVLAAVAEATAIVVFADLRVDDELLDAAPRLKIVANVARGFDNFDLDALERRGVYATNVPDAFTVPTAESALGLLLMTMRNLARGDRFVRAGSWTLFEPGRWDGQTLEGKTLGLVGYGKIGQAVAHRAAAFGMTIVFHQRTPGDQDTYRWLPLDELLAISDVVSLHTPATPETRHLINEDTLARMKSGSVLINTARGSVVDEAALAAALERGHLAGAGLDVTECEPAVHPSLLALDNVVITPHLGGGTVESRQAARACAIANVAAVLAGQPPLNPIR